MFRSAGLFQILNSRTICQVSLAVTFFLIGTSGSLFGQTTPPGNGNNGGILIDPAGVIRGAITKSEGAAVSKKRRETFARDKLAADILESADLRVVSLVEIEGKIADLLAKQQPVPPSLQYLSGLTRIDYLFIDEEEKDLCLAGPAEGFGPDQNGLMVGLTSGRPVIAWEDLVVAFRAVRSGERTIGCTIDPVPENMTKFQDFLRKNNSAAFAADAQRRFQELTRILGMQTVKVWGVPPETHFGQVLVAADYRMKRITLGLDPSGVRGLKSNLAMLTPGADSLQRWWFASLYDPVEMSPDRQAFHLSGQRIQLFSQDQLGDVQGNRRDAATSRQSTEAFAKQFTDAIPELAQAQPVFAELQNLFDLAVVATLCEEHKLADKVGWSMSTLLDPAKMPVATGVAPKTMPSEYNSRKAGRSIVALIGGVTVLPGSVARTAKSHEAMSSTLANLKSQRAKRPRPN